MRTARRTHGFRESVIRGMSRVAREHGAINLAQGFPNFAAPDVLKAAAARAIAGDINQYATTWGAQRLREAIAASYQRNHGLAVEPDREVTVTCGATEAMIATLLAVVDPGEEVVVFEPFYENYGPDVILSDAKPVFVPLLPGEPLDLDRLRAACSAKTRAIVVNTPANPSGRVLTRAELEAIRDLCVEYDILAVTDEIYEHMVYEGAHVPLATLPGMRERTITISGASKTFSVTGWRIGWIVAPAPLTEAIRKVHDFLTVGAPAPLQDAVAEALEVLPPSFYAELRDHYAARCDRLLPAVRDAGFRVRRPEGAYYLLADIGDVTDLDDRAFALWLAQEVKVATVPGSSFFHHPGDGARYIRFVFCKTDDLLDEAARRLRTLPSLAVPARRTAHAP